MIASLLTLLALAAVPEGSDTALVCPAPLSKAMEPWVEFRESQGHRIVRIDSRGSAEDIRARLRETARHAPLRFVVLVGDDDPARTKDADVANRSLPTFLIDAKVNVHWGSEPQLATDSRYGDLDDDGVPEVAVGRLTADSPEELTVMVNKIVAYERTAEADVSRRRINFVAGTSGLGALADGVLESTARTILCDHVPPAYCTSMTYAAWRSPYCPHPAAFHDTTVARLNEGCLFWVYMGHGQRQFVEILRMPDRWYPVLDVRDAPRLRTTHCPPLAIMLCCYTGAFDEPDDCLAEEFLRSRGGPVAVIGSSRVTMPYGMSVLGTEMLDECFRGRRETLGELLLAAQRDALLRPRTDSASKFLDSLAALMNPGGADLAAERAEHVQLFNLLGDPLLRLHQPEEVHVQAPADAVPGTEIEISGEAPFDGEAEIELVVRRDRLTFAPPTRRTYDASPKTVAEYAAVYRQANDGRLTLVRAPVTGGKFSTRLKVPDDARGPCHVRVLVCSPQACAVGAADLLIALPATAPAKTVSRPASPPR